MVPSESALYWSAASRFLTLLEFGDRGFREIVRADMSTKLIIGVVVSIAAATVDAPMVSFGVAA